MNSIGDLMKEALQETPGWRALLDGKQNHGPLQDKLKDHWDSPRRWAIIRAFYAEVTPMILKGERIDPHAIGLCEHMTPIERAIWTDIRNFGLPFYPQYPVGRRFVDFGDPVGRLAIEVDGAAFHTPDGDAQKDADLAAERWSVFRVPGRIAWSNDNPLAEILPDYGLRADGSRYRPPTEDDDEIEA